MTNCDQGSFSFANALNLAGHVVGDAGTCGGNGCAVHGFLWQNGAMADVNTLVASSDLRVTDAVSINDRDEIVGYGALPNGNEHQVMLIPRDEADREGIVSNAPAQTMVPPAVTPRANAVSCATLPSWRARPPFRYRLPCFKD